MPDPVTLAIQALRLYASGRFLEDRRWARRLLANRSVDQRQPLILSQDGDAVLKGVRHL